MSFEQANPERAGAVPKYFHMAFDELLLSRVFDAGQGSTFSNAKSSPVLTSSGRLLPVAACYTTHSPCLTQLLAAFAHSISSVINK